MPYSVSSIMYRTFVWILFCFVYFFYTHTHTHTHALSRMSATFICLGMPNGAHFGIDTKTWQVGPRFQGVSHIPEGTHFIYYSANEMMSGIGRMGFFHFFKRDEVYVRKWNQENEFLASMNEDDVERVKLAFEKGQFCNTFGPYPADQLDSWKSLCSCISKETLALLQQRSNESNEESQEKEKKEKFQEYMKDDLSNIPFVEVPKRLVVIGESAQNRTVANFDKTTILEQLVEKEFNNNLQGLLCELQVAYITFYLAFSFDGFEQWKKIVHLLCGCEEALVKYDALYQRFLAILDSHLKMMPKDFLVDMGMWDDNFLKSSLSSLLSSILEPRISAPLRLQLIQFKEKVEAHFDYIFEEDGEDAPVIVDPSEFEMLETAE